MIWRLISAAMVYGGRSSSLNTINLWIVKLAKGIRESMVWKSWFIACGGLACCPVACSEAASGNELATSFSDVLSILSLSDSLDESLSSQEDICFKTVNSLISVLASEASGFQTTKAKLLAVRVVGQRSNEMPGEMRYTGLKFLMRVL